MAVHYIGVRHHSPACARIVADAIERIRPGWVLIEGPVDMNDRLDELLLGHQLPVALYSYVHGEGVHFGSWTPFCEYSPEWQALTAGTAIGAKVRFIDLPAWHWALRGRENRFGDNEERYTTAIARLCDHFRVDGLDSLWDHLFEQREPTGDTASRMATYFEELRSAEDGTGEFDDAREQYMAEWVAAATATGENVIVVTGGFHTAAIRSLAEKCERTGMPAVPAPDGPVRSGSYLVPFSYKRLDSFVGYQSGMPSPAWYDLVFSVGNQRTSEMMLERIVHALRDKKQPVSAADLIAAQTMSDGLARLRNHQDVLRTDLLDGLASALIKDSQDVPFPWTRRGPIAAGTDPIIVEIAKTMSGTQRGRLHPDTPLPPLVADAEVQLRHPQLFGDSDEASKGVELDLIVSGQLEASRILHRLRTLNVPGIERVRGGKSVGGFELQETWALTRNESQLPALIEAAAYGATVEAAAASKVADQLGAASGDPDRLSEVLAQAVLIGIAHLTEDVIEAVQQSVRACHDVRPLGSLLATAVALFRYDTVLESAGDTTLAEVIATTFERCIWLFEGLAGSSDPQAITDAVLALKHALQCTITPPLPRQQALDVMHRVSVAAGVGHETRGAAFGFCWAVDDRSLDRVTARSAAQAAFATSNRAETLGDWLAGLFALARDEVVNDDLGDHSDEQGASLIELIDGAIVAMSDTDFLRALPSLRMAFSWFPPRERETLAQRVLARHGIVGQDALQPLAADPQTIAAGTVIDGRVDDVVARYALKAPQSAVEE